MKPWIVLAAFLSLPLFAATPSRTLLRNAALVLTMDPTMGTGKIGILENADVLIVGEKIERVGPKLEVEDVEVVDATGRIVMPGFVDVHNHLWQSLIRGCAADKNLLGWLDECVFTMKHAIGESEAHAGVTLSLLDLLGTGVTTVVDDSHSFTPAFVEGNLKALEESGIRYVYAYCGGADSVDAIRTVKKTRFDGRPLATLQTCSHPVAAMEKDLTAMAKLAKELGVMLNVHLLENVKQRNDKPIAILKKIKAWESSLFVNHAVHLTPAELKDLVKKGVRVAHNPLSNMRLASGIAPVPALHAAGAKMGLGLDGGTNDTSDAFANMRAAVGLQRAKTLRTDIYPTVEDVLRLATLGGAEALGKEKEIGSLTPGKRADVILIDPGTPNFAPRWDWIAQLVLNGQPHNVEAVWVDGRPLKKKGVVIGIFRETTVKDAEAAVARIRSALKKTQ